MEEVMETVDLVLLGVLQLIVVIYIRVKHRELSDSVNMIFMYIPIIGPIAMGMTVLAVGMFVAPFLIPVVFKFLLDKASDKIVNKGIKK